MQKAFETVTSFNILYYFSYKLYKNNSFFIFWLFLYDIWKVDEIYKGIISILFNLFLTILNFNKEDSISGEWSDIESIEKNKTWELTILPKGGKPIRGKWVFQTKLNKNEEVDKYKGRLVAKGYAQP